MNPGAFVAGGGGNGGGKGGKGGKNGDGSEGAGTEDGDADANGDGNSADGCGAGSDGECNNCDTVIEAGDPVDVITGAVKTTAHRDLFLPAFFNLELRRTYSSSRIAEDVGLGWGWNHSFAWSFEEHRKHIFIRSGDGRVVEFPGLPDVGMEAFSGGWALRRIKGGFVLRPGNEFLHVFAKRKGHKHAYHLVRVGYRNRGHLSLQYEKGQLARIVDTAGRVVLFKRNSDGRVVSVSVPDPRGNTIIFAQYAYHPSGDLAAATDADGNTTYFFYDEAHRLIRLQYPNGITFHFRYDRVGRCFETWGERPGPDPALAPGLPETLADGTTVAKGIYHNHIAFTDEGYSELVDSVGMRRFEQGTDGKITTAVNERGGVTSRTLDDRGRVIEQVDANASAWQWAYDYLGNVIKETDPLGGEMKVQRDHEGREVSITDQAGGQLTLERDGHGEVVGVVNQTGARLAFRRNARGRIVEVIDRRGARHLFEWDAHGNCTARTFPNGSTYRWTYDYWGRKLSETDPQGATASYAYTRRGRLIQMVDRIGRRITFDYDAMGNLVREILPDGSVTRHDYGGLNWCYQTVLPDGSTRRRLFNREGWMVRAEDEVGQAHELEYEPDGRVLSERFADGRAHVFEYDLVGHLIAYDEGDGKYLRTLNAVGQVLETEAPDGSKRTFSYDSRGFVLSAELGGIKTEFERDATGVVTCERQNVDSTTYVLDTECDPEGEPTRLVSSLGFEQKLRRDGNGYVERIYVSDMPTVRFERSLLGTVTRRELELQASIVDTLDVANRLKRREIVQPGAAKNSGEPELVGAKPNAREWYYDYTQIDEIASVTEGNEHDAFEYDVRRHIKRRTSNAGRDEVFSVDPAGNYTAANGVTRTFKPGNQLRSHSNVSYTYDELGQLIEKTIHTDNAEETWEYTWNAWRQLEKVKRPDGSQIEYAYDAFSRRQAKRVLNRTGNIERHEHYVWNWTEIAHEVKLDAAGVLDSCRTYLYEDADRDNPIAHRDGEGAWVHYVGDLNDSPVELIDAAGRSLGRIDRASFGEQQARADSSEDSHIAFPGQYVDGDIGLHYNRYRYYDPQAGRYISPDPIGFDGGWNFYAYGPNPVGWYDPLGTRHRMTVTGAPDGMIQHAERGSGSTYASGMADCPTSGPTGSLRSRARCHTEQKLAHDMIAYDRAERAAGRPGLQGRTIRARGQYPPCPNCHRALQRAAAETGATVEYSWDHNGEENSITYSGHTAEFEGDAAVRLSEGYGMFQDPGRRNGYGFDSYYGEDSATAVYSELTGELPELED